jgi:hypothetical protein
MTSSSKSLKTPNKLIYGILFGFSILIIIISLFPHYIGFILIPIVKAGILAVICLIYGLTFQLIFKRNKLSLETSFAIGLIVTTFYFFLLGFLNQLNTYGFFVYLILALPAGIYVFKFRNTKLKSLFGFGDNKFSVGYLILLFPLLYAALPISFFDSLVYHLGIPNLYIQNGGFFPTPQFLYANTSIYYEISLMPAVFCGDMVPRLFHLIVGMVLILAITNLARDYLGVSKHWILTVLIITMPMSSFLLTTVKNDLGSALFILLGIKYLLGKKYFGSGCFWGFALGVKYFNIIPLGIFLVLYWIQQKKLPIKNFIHFISGSIIMMIPLLAKNIIYANNPIFPFLFSWFPTEFWDESRFRMMIQDVGKACISWKDFFSLPYSLSFKEIGSGGRVGIQFLVFLPFLILFKKKNLLLLSFSFVSIVVGCGFTGSIRFLFFAFIILCIYVVWVFEKKPHKPFKVLMTVIILINSIYSIILLNYLYKPSILYKENYSLDEYRTFYSPAYEAIKFINQKTPKHSLILVIGETKNYCLKRPYRLASAIDYSILKPILKKTKDLDEWLDELKNWEIDYLMVNLPEFYRLNNQYKRLSDSDQKMAISFFKQLKPVFFKNGVYVFQISESTK